MEKKKMLIGTACSVQQRVLTRLPGIRRASLSFPLLPSRFLLLGPRGQIPFSRYFRLDAGFPQRGALSKAECARIEKVDGGGGRERMSR